MIVIRIYWANGDLERGRDIYRTVEKIIKECSSQGIKTGNYNISDIPDVSWSLEVSKKPFMLSRPFEVIDDLISSNNNKYFGGCFDVKN